MIQRRIGRIAGMLLGLGMTLSAVYLFQGKRIDVQSSPRAVEPDAGETYHRRMKQTERMLIDNRLDLGGS